MIMARTPNKRRAVSDDAIARLGARIATARIRRGIVQPELARKAAITVPTLRNVERGVPGTSISAVAAVMWALGLLDDLERMADPATDRAGLTIDLARQGRRATPIRLDDNF